MTDGREPDATGVSPGAAAAACSICGCPLPNRYAVAGRCEAAGCEAPFCALHFRRGNRRCRAHGWEPAPLNPLPSTPDPRLSTPTQEGASAMSATEENAAPEGATPKKKLTPAAARRVMRETLERVRRLGAGAGDLVRKLRKDRSPQAMLGTIEQSAEANRLRREEVAGRLEQQFAAITARKKAFASAPPARKRILEAELSSLLSQYKASERELAVLLENEKVLAQTRGRIQELIAYGMAGVTELQIDDLVEDVEETVADAEGRLDAARDLERAGRRRERASEKESLWSELEGFGEEEEERGSRVEGTRDEGQEQQAPEEPEAAEPRKEPELPQ